MADTLERPEADCAGASAPGAPRVPAVFVLWHPACALGRPLAQSLFDWLRPGLGVGPDVFFRSAPAPECEGRPGLPPPLPFDPREGRGGLDGRSNLQLLLPLIDANMVADEAWRWWLDGLARQPRDCSVLLPVALDGTAYNLSPAVRALNAIRPSGLPPADAAPAALEPAIRSLRKQVTEALTRLVLPRRTEGGGERAASVDEAPPKIGLFLSHAKRDGTGPARAIRDHIHGQTQLAAFFDDNDIAYGAAFARVLDGEATGADTAALIAVRSAAYATRPWCRREFFEFRTPRLAARGPGDVERWRLNPALIVEAMEGATYSPGMAEAGNTSLVRWSDADPAMAETVVTTVLRDAMLRAFHDALAASLPPPDRRGVLRVVINWLPDPVTLLRIPALRAPAREVEVVYPGRGLPGQDLRMLGEFFPGVAFRAFEAVRGAPPPAPSLDEGARRDDPRRLLVGLSVSADPDDLLARGLSDAHLRELLVRLGRPILRHGASLAYGGMWREGAAEENAREENDFTFDLLRLVRAEQEEAGRQDWDGDGDCDGEDAVGAPEPGKLYSFAPWPFTLGITPAVEAQWVTACRIVRVEQADAGLPPSAVLAGRDFDRESRRARLNAACALSAMRRAQTEGRRVPVPGLPKPVRVPRLTERVLLGGRLSGYGGFVPGLFEEFLLGAERECPVYLLGGFGGAAGVLARAILGEGRDRPRELTSAGLEAMDPRLATLRQAQVDFGLPEGLRGTQELLDAVFAQVLRARREPAAVLNLRLSRAEIREMLTTSDIVAAARLVRGAFERAHGLPPLPV